MSEFDREMYELGAEVERGLVAERYKLFSFDGFKPGDYMVMELPPADELGIKGDFGQLITGELIDPIQAVIHVTSALHQKSIIVGREIGLAVRAPLPIKSSQTLEVIVKRCVSPNLRMAYYFPDQQPKPYIHATGTKYGRVAVAGTTLFDIRPML